MVFLYPFNDKSLERRGIWTLSALTCSPGQGPVQQLASLIKLHGGKVIRSLFHYKCPTGIMGGMSSNAVHCVASFWVYTVIPLA